MDAISINASNAFGIGSLDCSFNMTQGSCVAIYAPNGTCKTSLRKSIESWSKGSPVHDVFFPERPSSFELTTSPSDLLKRENVFCFQSMGDLATARFFDERLLASPELKARYIKYKEEHDARLANLLSALRKVIAAGNGSPKDDEMLAFICDLAERSDLGDAFAQLLELVDAAGDPLYVSKYKLSDVLAKSIETALAKPGVQEAFADYAKVRNQVLEKSVYFGDGFDYLAATTLAAELDKSKFFDAGHTLTLRNRLDGTTELIASCSSLKTTIDNEIKRTDSDQRVIESFKVADEKLGKASTVKKFKDLIGSDFELASAMSDPKSVKLAYLIHAVRVCHDEVEQYLVDRKAYLQHMANLREELAGERSDWDTAVQLFLNRFQLPVKPYVRNRQNVVLGSSEPVIAFKYLDADVANDVLIESLSDGEKKALYMLSVVFEIERSKRLDGPKLYVFDDVVDSFDYVNKYAFIEYLRDFVDADDTYAILLTHNFDFFRTVASRLSTVFKRQNCLLAEKNESGTVELKVADFISKAPLIPWKKKLDNDIIRIASIAMVRELVEMRDGNQNSDYARLSSVLHGGLDGQQITFNDLSGCYVKQIGCNDLDGDTRKVQDVLMNACAKISARAGRLALEEKVVLSIGIRTMVERYIYDAYAEHGLKSPNAKTLGALIGAFKHDIPSEYEAHASCIDRTVLIVPENIHVNGFMYEPLVDIGSHSFMDLYGNCLYL